jgi:hypothetical protein
MLWISAKFVPCLLNEEDSINTCWEVKERLDSDPEFISKIFIGDEKWVDVRNQHRNDPGKNNCTHLSNFKLHEIFESWRLLCPCCKRSQGNYFDGDNIYYKAIVVVVAKWIKSGNYFIPPRTVASTRGYLTNTNAFRNKECEVRFVVSEK